VTEIVVSSGDWLAGQSTQRSRRLSTRHRPWNVQEIIDSALALVPTLPLWAAAAFVGGSMYIVGSVGYAVINAYIQLAQRASAAS
jgi:hypothetical protein